MRQPRSSSINSTITAEDLAEVKAKKVPRGARQAAVSWSNQCLVRIIPGSAHLSEEELAETYYRAEDYKRIQEDVSESSFLMKHGSSETDEVTFRGLESKRPGESRRRKLHRFMVCRAVIAGMDHQYSVDSVDDEFIGEICRSLTSPSRVDALERGASDAVAVDQPSPVGHSSISSEEAFEEPTVRGVDVVPVVIAV
jgi:hypothetical protein